MGGAAAPAASRPTAAPTAADSAARDLTPLPQKLEMLEALGVDITLVLKFDQELADQEAEAFIRGFLLPVLRCRSVVAGYDCSFGKGREGNADLLRRVAQTLPAGQGFSVREEAPLLVKGEPVSSTRIRKLLLAGEIADLPALLGRRYTVFGPVVEGYRRGGPLLGFPTANIRADDYFLPAQGVYATFVEMGGKLWPSVSSLGFNPSFGNQSISLETHILDFSGDLYGQNLTLHFVERLRPEQRFNSLEDLKRHIQLDIDHARRIFAAI